MKIIPIFLLFCLTINAQIKLNPRVGIDVTTKEVMSIGNPFTYYDNDGVQYTKGPETVYLPSVKTLIGLEINYKAFSLIFDNITWENPDFEAFRFAPEQSRFDVMLECKLFNKLKIGLAHACYHPIKVSYKQEGTLYGGFSSIYLHYGY